MRRLASILVIILSLVISGLIIYKYHYTSSVVLNGNEKIVISYKSDYHDQGFTLKRGEQEIDYHEAEYEMISNVDTNQLGEYIVTYRIKYRNHTYELKREVEVTDNIAPVINTSVDEVDKDFCNNKITTEYTVSAEDNYDGDITDKIEKEELDDKIVFKVTDSFGNVATKELHINTKDKPDNKIVLNGKASMSVSLNGSYKEEGAYYADGCGKKIDDEITIEGSVDTSKTGKYTITYTSKTNNNIKATRTVSVVNMPAAQSAPVTGNSVIYLTFDDGPCYYTKKVLDILDKYNIKATFFVTNQISGYKNMIAEEAKRGHTIGVHTLTHQWNIYNSLEAYWNDFNAMNDIIEQQTGKRTTILRFPGGTSNRMSKVGMSTIVNSVNEKGLRYYDWNVCVEDAGACVKSSNKQQCVYNYFVNGLQPGRDNIVLMHDLKSYTADSLERMIKYALDKGYTFKAIDENTAQVHFKPYK